MVETIKNKVTGETGEILGRTEDGVTVRVNGHTTWWKNDDLGAVEVKPSEKVNIKSGKNLTWFYHQDATTHYYEAEGKHDYDYLIEASKFSDEHRLDVNRKSDGGVFESFKVFDENEGYDKAEEWEEEWAPENDKSTGDTNLRIGDRVDYTNPEGLHVGEGMVCEVSSVSGGGYRYAVNFIDFAGHRDKGDRSHLYSSNKGLKLLLRPEDPDAAISGWYRAWETEKKG